MPEKAVLAIGLTPEEHAERRVAVGASEVYDALFNQAALWLRKTGREPPSDDSALSRLGNAIEPYIIGECMMARDIHDVTFKPKWFARGHMGAHLDAIGHLNDQSVAIEAKWRGHRDGWGEPGTADVPRPILLQTMAQMHVAELRLALVPVLFMRPPVAIYEVPYDAELGEMIEAGVNRFWQYVETDEPPPVNPEAPEAIEIIRKLYPGTNGQRIAATRGLEYWRTVCQEASKRAKEYESASDVAKAHLLSMMGECAELEFADGAILRRKLTKRKAYSVAECEYIDARFIKSKE